MIFYNVLYHVKIRINILRYVIEFDYVICAFSYFYLSSGNYMAACWEITAQISAYLHRLNNVNAFNLLRVKIFIFPSRLFLF